MKSGKRQIFNPFNTAIFSATLAIAVTALLISNFGYLGFDPVSFISVFLTFLIVNMIITSVYLVIRKMQKER